MHMIWPVESPGQLEPPPQYYRNTFFRRWSNAIVGCESNERVIALTFDDGPDPDGTPEILARLREYGVPATFFVLGPNVARYPHLARLILDDGHAIGNHGYSHTSFDMLGPARLRRELADTSREILAATGTRTHLMRPPYGIETLDMHILTRLLGYESVLWSIDGKDWRGDPATDVAGRVCAEITSGAIVLLHDGWQARPDNLMTPDEEARVRDRTPTVEALDQIIRRSTSLGYRFTTVPELLRHGSPRLQPWYLPA